MAEKVVYVRAPKKEHAEKIDLNVFFDSMLAAGAIAIIYFVGWPLAQKLIKGEIKFPDLSNLLNGLKFPVLGSQLPRNGGGAPTTPSNGGVTAGGAKGSEGITWFKANGETQKMPASRQDGQSNRWSLNTRGWNTNGFEVTVYLQMSGMTGDGHIGLKQLGPNHTSPCGHKEGGQCCCWYDMGYRANGAVQVQTERPHPNNHTHPCQGNCGNIGRSLADGKILGVKWLGYKDGGSWRVQGWVDPSGQLNANQWKPTYNILDNGKMLPNYNPPNDIEIEIRISDIPAKNIKMLNGPWARKI